MELKDLKTVTGLIDSKLKKQARKEKELIAKEEKELNEITQEETQDITQDGTQEDNDNNATIMYVLSGVVAVMLGSAVYLKLKRANNE